MEDDIKELEAFVNHYKNLGYFGVIQAIENLIARNKELEKENNNLRDTNKKLFELAQHSAMQEFINEDYIPKSKVEELKEIDNIDLLQFKIKQLLQEGDK